MEECVSSPFSDLNATLPPKIEKMLMCEELDLAGVLGTVLETVSNLDLLSLLDLSSALNILGDSGLSSGLSGVLAKGSNRKSSKLPLPLPSLSKATGAVSSLLPLAQGALGSLLPNTLETDPGKKADSDLTPLSNRPLSGVLSTVGELTEPANNVLKSVVPGGLNDALSGLLGNLNVKDLLIG